MVAIVASFTPAATVGRKRKCCATLADLHFHLCHRVPLPLPFTPARQSTSPVDMALRQGDPTAYVADGATIIPLTANRLYGATDISVREGGRGISPLSSLASVASTLDEEAVYTVMTAPRQVTAPLHGGSQTRPPLPPPIDSVYDTVVMVQQPDNVYDAADDSKGAAHAAARAHLQDSDSPHDAQKTVHVIPAQPQ